MFKRLSLTSIAAGAVFALAAAGTANAAVFSIVGGTADVLPAANANNNGGFNPTNLAAINADGVGVGTAITYFNSANAASGGLLVSPQLVNLTFTFMGKEAGFLNAADSQLSWNGTPLFDNTAAPGTTSATVGFDVGSSPGLVPFLFRNISLLVNAINGGPIEGAPDALRLAFYVSGSVAYAFFDDAGAGPITHLADHDYDDMVVRITATDQITNPTPIPGAVFLFGSVLAGGMGGVQLMRRRRAIRTA